jgi:hypothetical protein
MSQEKVTFVEVRQVHGQGGGLVTASDYVFEQDGQEFCARVTWEAIRTLDGQLSDDEVKLAAQRFLEEQISKGWTQAGAIAELNSNAMEVVAIKLGWAHRFRKLMERSV